MIFDRIRSMVSLQLDIDEDKITLETHIADELGADSLDLVELMMAAEEEFLIVIEEEDLKDFKTVGDVVRYIENAI